MYTTQTVENQEVLWLPTNDDTRTIVYDTKFLKSSEGRYPPLRWTVTKIEDTAVDGISRFTLAQDQFDPAKDNAELGIANYWEFDNKPECPKTEEVLPVSDLEIVYSASPVVKAGGGYKQLTLKAYVEGELVKVTDEVTWSISDLGKNGENVMFITNSDTDYIKHPDYVTGNPFKIKCTNYSLVGKTFTVTATVTINGITSSKSLVMEVTSL